MKISGKTFIWYTSNPQVLELMIIFDHSIYPGQNFMFRFDHF